MPAKRTDTLRAYWSKRNKLVVDTPDTEDGYLLWRELHIARASLHSLAEERPLLEELEARGYDITTLKFSIRKKRGGE